jgi:hypothetical protein
VDVVYLSALFINCQFNVVQHLDWIQTLWHRQDPGWVTSYDAFQQTIHQLIDVNILMIIVFLLFECLYLGVTSHVRQFALFFEFSKLLISKEDLFIKFKVLLLVLQVLTSHFGNGSNFILLLLFKAFF